MNHLGTIRIDTERLTLRRLEQQDAKQLFELGCIGHTEVEAEHIVFEMCKNYIDTENYNWAIEFEGKVIGRIKVTEISSRDNFVQLGYDLGFPYRMKGFMTEAVRGVTRYLFINVGVHRIYGQCRSYNIASARVMQKAGMIYEGRQRKHYIENDGTYSDVDIYGIIREEYEDIS